MERLLRHLERRFGRYAIHNISFVLLAPQVMLYLVGMVDPQRANRAFEQMVLWPSRLLEGEVWRAVSFLAIPEPTNPIFFLFYVMIFHLFCAGLQSQWGPMRLNLYVLFAWIFTLVGALIAGQLDPGYVHLRGFSDLYTTVLLGFATLNPEFTINLFGILPVKARWIGWIAALTALYRFGLGSWGVPADYADRVIILASFLNYLLFFGPALLRGQVEKASASSRRRRFEEAMRRGHEERERALMEEERTRSDVSRDEGATSRVGRSDGEDEG